MICSMINENPNILLVGSGLVTKSLKIKMYIIYMTIKLAVILRGYHYDYNHKTMSGFWKNYHGAYTVDYERHWLDSFKKTIMNDKRFDCDYFIVTNKSEKLNKLLEEIKPVHYKIKDMHAKRTDGISRRTGTILDSSELVDDYCKEHNVSYDFLLNMRLDQKINRNPLDFFDYKIKNNVSVFLLDVHTLNKTFCDYIYLIPFKFNKYFIHVIKKHPQIINLCVTPMHHHIYNFIQLTPLQSDMLQIDRQFYCCHHTLHETFQKIIWKENINEYSKKELEQNFNDQIDEVNEKFLTEKQIEFFKSISYDK